MARCSRFTLLVGSVLAIAGSGSPLAAETAGGARIVSEVRLSPTETAGIVEGLPPHRASGPLYPQAPPPPERGGRDEEGEETAAPVIRDAGRLAPVQTVETESRPPGGPVDDPGSFVLLRNSTLGPNAGFISSVSSPSVGGQGNGIFSTFNWYAAVSLDNGGTFSYTSPFSLFPAAPSAFSAGFCCNQRVAQDSSRDLIFWYLQYLKTGSTATSTNGVRLALTHGESGLAFNSWIFYDFSPSTFGLPAGTWLHQPHLQASANHLYFTTNVFHAEDDSFYGALIVRLSLDQLANGVPLTVQFFTVAGSYGSLLPVHGAGAEGSRPGRTTQHFASVSSSTSIKVLTWPEASPVPTVSTVGGLSTTGTAGFACPGPDGLDPCTRATVRMQAGWITDSELGFLWHSSQDADLGRPYPYIRSVLLDPATLAVLAQPDLFNTTSACLYPALSVNERGHLGGTFDLLGGERFPTLVALIRDELSPDLAASGWEGYGIAVGEFGTPGRHGDYNGAAPHERFPKTWLAAGHRQVGGSADADSVIHNFWFGRRRDNPEPAACTSFFLSPQGADPTASAGSESVFVFPSPGGCVGGWTAEGNGSWLTVSPSGGTGFGVVTVSWAENASPSSRSDVAAIAGQSFFVNQAGVPPPCTGFSISPTGLDVPSTSGADFVTITASPPGCEGGDWTATGNGSWLSVSPTAGTGSSSVVVFWDQNNSPSSRSGVATIAGLPFTVNQAGPKPTTPADFDGDGVSDWVVYRSGTWFYLGPCLHPLNETGPALDPACSVCVETVCNSDSFCCNSSWDGICVGEAVSFCQ